MGHRRLFVLSAIALAVIISPILGFGPLTDSQRVDKLGKPNLSKNTVRKLLVSIEDKPRVRFGVWGADDILELAEMGMSCDYRGILWGREIIKAINKESFPSVFEYANFHYEQWELSCVEKFGKFFQGHQLLAELDDGRIPVEGTQMKLNSIEDKKNVKFSGVSVETLLDQASKTYSVDDCLGESLRTRGSYLFHPYPTLVDNLQEFDKARERLFSFCAENIKAVFEQSLESYAKSAHKKDYIKSIAKLIDSEEESEFETWICSALRGSMEIVAAISAQLSQAIPDPIDGGWLEIRTACEIDLGKPPEDFQSFGPVVDKKKLETLSKLKLHKTLTKYKYKRRLL